MGIQCKVNARYCCRDTKTYDTKVMEAYLVAFFGGHVWISGERDVENVGHMGWL